MGLLSCTCRRQRLLSFVRGDRSRERPQARRQKYLRIIALAQGGTSELTATCLQLRRLTLRFEIVGLPVERECLVRDFIECSADGGEFRLQRRWHRVRHRWRECYEFSCRRQALQEVRRPGCTCSE